LALLGGGLVTASLGGGGREEEKEGERRPLTSPLLSTWEEVGHCSVNLIVPP